MSVVRLGTESEEGGREESMLSLRSSFLREREVRERRIIKFWERSRVIREDRGAGQSAAMADREFLPSRR